MEVSFQWNIVRQNHKQQKDIFELRHDQHNCYFQAKLFVFRDRFYQKLLGSFNWLNYFQVKHKQQKRPSSVGDVERVSRNDEKFSFRRKRRSDGVLSYYDDNRTPSPTYTETKASILRRRKNVKPEPAQTGLNRTRKSTFNRIISSSLSDLRGRESVVVKPEEENDLKPGELVRQNSTPSNLGVWKENFKTIFLTDLKYLFGKPTQR